MLVVKCSRSDSNVVVGDIYSYFGVIDNFFISAENHSDFNIGIVILVFK